MRTLNYVVLALVAILLAFGSVGCEWLESGDDSPTSPSPLTTPSNNTSRRENATHCVDHEWSETREVGSSTWYFYTYTNTCIYRIHVLWTDNDTRRMERYGDNGWKNGWAYDFPIDPGESTRNFVQKASYDNTNPEHKFCAATVGVGRNPCGENNLD